MKWKEKRSEKIARTQQPTKSKTYISKHSATQPHKDRIISKYTESVDRCVYDTLSVLLLSNHLISRQTIVLSLSLYSLYRDICSLYREF